jgi:hypothetical protein
MPLRKTTKFEDEGTAKQTLRMNSDWLPSVHFSDTDETQINLVIETIDDRFVLDIYVTDREAACAAFQNAFITLQELQIGD